MADPARLISKPQDSKARLVSIFAGAVLLPSIALSVLTFDSVPRQAEAMKITMFKRAEKDLYFIEKDLQEAARAKVLEIARKIGPETLLEARPWRVRKALKQAGLSPDMFESLNLEAASRHKGLQKLVSDDRDLEGIKEALEMIRIGEEPTAESDGQEDAVILTSEGQRRRGCAPLPFCLRVRSRRAARGILRERVRQPPRRLGGACRQPLGKGALRERADTERPLRGQAHHDQPVLQGPEALPSVPRQDDRAGDRALEAHQARHDRVSRSAPARRPVPRVQQRPAGAQAVAPQERFRRQRQP